MLPNPAQTNGWTYDQCRNEFYRLSRLAIAAGKLTAAERDIICRPGTRKYIYFGRHLLDLKTVLAERGFVDPQPPISKPTELPQAVADKLTSAGPILSTHESEAHA
jgi:hypothetical protein